MQTLESDWAGPLLPLVEVRPRRREYVVTIAGRRLRTTAVFDTYWRFAAERQEIFYRRLRGERELTRDWILAAHRFTNAYRASDRVSQFLIREVIGKSSRDARSVFFRVLLFKLFNRIGTWVRLEEKIGASPDLHNYDFESYCSVLDDMMQQGERVYSSAYIMPSPRLGHERKHANHLALLEKMVADNLPEKLTAADSLSKAYKEILAYPSLGPFLAFQFTIDLNYSSLLKFRESEFVVPGPGARDGIRKCFVDLDGVAESDVIAGMAEMADREFDRLGLRFTFLWGRPLQLIDCQNLFCEVDKYARYAHPEAIGISGRTRIKQRYRSDPTPLRVAYPSKWNLSQAIPGLPDPLRV